MKPTDLDRGACVIRDAVQQNKDILPWETLPEWQRVKWRDAAILFAAFLHELEQEEGPRPARTVQPVSWLRRRRAS